MTDKEKAKAYDEALERAKSLIDKEGITEGSYPNRNACEAIFPELAESEDERIRKEIINFLRSPFVTENITDEKIAPWISYLEKQKVNTDGDFARGYDCGYECCLNSHGAEWFEKQKEQPADAKSERVIKAARRVLNNWLDGTDCPDVSGDFAELEYAIREYDGEEKQKPDYCHHEVDLSGCSDEYSKGYYDGWNNCNQQHSQLEAEQKSLQNILDTFEGEEPRKEWKPSEEQLKALKNIAYGYYQNGDGPILRELYDNLKNYDKILHINNIF